MAETWLSSSSWSESQEARANRSFQCFPPAPHRCNHSGRGDQNCAPGNLAGQLLLPSKTQKRRQENSLRNESRQVQHGFHSENQLMPLNSFRLILRFVENTCEYCTIMIIQVMMATACHPIARSTVPLHSAALFEPLFEVMMASFAWTAFMATLQTVVDAGRAKTPTRQRFGGGVWLCLE